VLSHFDQAIRGETKKSFKPQINTDFGEPTGWLFAPGGGSPRFESDFLIRLHLRLSAVPSVYFSPSPDAIARSLFLLVEVEALIKLSDGNFYPYAREA
jgi:hypothetical protein